MDTDISLRRLHHLILLEEELSFTRAAKRAGLSQAAFSRGIQALEAQLGVRIFDRGTRSVRTTPAGRQLLVRARKLLADSEGLWDAAREISRAEGGVLTFGASQIAVDGVLTGILPAFTRQRPGLRLILLVGQSSLMRENLEQERIEFFVGYSSIVTSRSHWQTAELQPERASLFCRPGHPLLAAQRRLSLEMVKDYPWAMVQLPPTPPEIEDLLCDLFALPSAADMPLRLSCESESLLREVMLSSDTILLTWSSWLEGDLRSAQVVDLGVRIRPLLPREKMQLPISIVRLKGRSLSPAAEELVEMLTRQAGSRSR